MPAYDVALLVTIEADSYEEALGEARMLAEGVASAEELSCSAVLDYERDNEGQRVLYLHPEETPDA